MIRVRYTTIDHVNKLRKFKTLAGARKFAQKMIGKNPEMGSYYAVSADGVGKIEVYGEVALRDLFGDGAPTDAEIEAEERAAFEKAMREEEEAERDRIIAEAEKLSAAERPKRDPRCTCSDMQLNLVGCDCNACRDDQGGDL